MTRSLLVAVTSLLFVASCFAQDTKYINKKLSQRWGKMNVKLFISTSAKEVRLDPDGNLATNVSPNCANYAEVFVQSIKVSENRLEIKARRTALPPQNTVEHPLPYDIRIIAALRPNVTDEEIEALSARIFTPMSPQLPPERSLPGFPKTGQSGVKPPRPSQMFNAETPDFAKKAGVGGNVWVEFTVNEDGSVSDVEPLTSDKYGLTLAAANIVSKHRFDPATLDGKPIKVRLRSENVFCSF